MSSDLTRYIDELKTTTAEKERILKEIEIAKGIQQSFLPDSSPAIAGFDIAAVSLPARVVGGDFYDFIPLDKDRWGLVVADVSGKGVPAALYMALSRTLIRASTIGRSSITDGIKQANRLMSEDSKANMFVTLFYIVLDAKKKSLEYLNAGHNPPLLFGESASETVLLKAQGAPLGLFNDIAITSDEIELKRDDVVILYTDGVTEAMNSRKERFEIERLSEVVRNCRALSAREILNKINSALEDYVGREPQFDDITLMVIKAV
jgi:sigma-B regulation protein RsbU (phosphoserine phosphatase)